MLTVGILNAWYKYRGRGLRPKRQTVKHRQKERERRGESEETP
jgi:hypothetical protein